MDPHALKEELEGFRSGPSSWSPATFQDGHASIAKWQSASASVIDLDFTTDGEDHTSIPDGARLSLLSELDDAPGTCFHFTPRGARLIFLYPAPCADRELCTLAQAGACELAANWIEKVFPKLPALRVDRASRNLAQRYFTPNARVRGEQRDAEILIIEGDRLYSPEELAGFALAMEEQGSSTEVHAPDCFRETERGVYYAKDGDESQLRMLLPARVRITQVIERVQGTVRHSAFKVQLTTSTGSQQSIVPSKELPSASRWLTEHFGRLLIAPNAELRNADRLLWEYLTHRARVSKDAIPELTICDHSGWHRLSDGSRRYLHAGNTSDEVCAELPPQLAPLKLPEVQTDSLSDAEIAAVEELVQLGSAKGLGAALLTTVIRAPLCDALGTPRATLHLTGTTGTGKTQCATIAQSFFGCGFAQDSALPASWNITACGAFALAHSAKDALLVIDDFKPSGDRNADVRLNRIADDLLRGAANGQGRARAQRDGSLAPGLSARCVFMSTGEDIPHGHSLRARLLILKLTPGDVLADPRETSTEDEKSSANHMLSQCQENAKAGVYAGVMAKLIRWMSARENDWWEKLKHRASAEKDTWRKRLQQAAHTRCADAIADLWIAVCVLSEWLADTGADSHRVEKLLRCIDNELVILAEAQTLALADADPVDGFFAAINEMLDASHVSISAASGQPTSGYRDVIGHHFGNEVGLIPGASIAAVKQYLSSSGSNFAHTTQAFGAILSEAGELVESKPGRHTCQRRIAGSPTRLWMISATRFPALHLHPTTPSDQQSAKESSHA